MSSLCKNKSNSVNGILNKKAALGRCIVERQDIHDTVIKPLSRKQKQKKIGRKIGAWNLRTLPQLETLANVTKEMESVKIDILDLAETQCRDSCTI